MQKQLRLSQKKVIDQYHPLFDSMIKVYHTSLSICGYVVCAMADYLATKQHKSAKELNEAIQRINESRLSSYLEKPMENIQLSRSLYCSTRRMSNFDSQNYLRDWVANFEIEDYLRQRVPSYTNRNVYFFRFCCYDFPEAMKNIKNEQAVRSVQQLPFKGEIQFVTVFDPFTHITKQAWKELVKARGFSQPLIIVTDLLGHFTTLVFYEGELRILDSMRPSYLHKQSVQEIHRLLKQATQ